VGIEEEKRRLKGIDRQIKGRIAEINAWIKRSGVKVNNPEGGKK